MTKQQFYQGLSHDGINVVEKLLDILKEVSADYCVIGGLAVNAYVEPVVSLDIDIVVASVDTEKVAASAEAQGFVVARFAHSLNLNHPKSDLRIQLQLDPVYLEFIPRAEVRDVLGYQMRVARLEDVLKGKLLAYSDESRRPSKRQKDLADIYRIIETRPEMADQLPKDRF